MSAASAKTRMSRQHTKQTMLCGIVGERLTSVTRRVPVDEPPPLPENAELMSIGKASPVWTRCRR